MKVVIRDYRLFLDIDGKKDGSPTEYSVFGDGVATSKDYQWVLDHIKHMEDMGELPIVAVFWEKNNRKFNGGK